MITKEKIHELLHSTETFRIERTASTTDMDKFQEAICAFANDLPDSRKNRDLQSNAPLRFYEFSGHLEIMNAGGLYGHARPENFPFVNDYRNPLVAGAMKTLGYVNMFNRGVRQVQSDLKDNGNKPAQFDVSLLTAFRVTVEEVISDVVKNVVKDVAKVDLSQLTDRQISTLEMMMQCPTITAKEMSQRLSVASRTIQRDIAVLTKLGKVVREGRQNNGKWIVLSKNE